MVDQNATKTRKLKSKLLFNLIKVLKVKSKRFVSFLVSYPGSIMVPTDQHLATMEHGGKLNGLLYPAKSKVSDDDNFVPRPNAVIPSLDHGPIHLLNVAKGAVAMADDV